MSQKKGINEEIKEVNCSNEASTVYFPNLSALRSFYRGFTVVPRKIYNQIIQKRDVALQRDAVGENSNDRELEVPVTSKSIYEEFCLSFLKTIEQDEEQDFVMIYIFSLLFKLHADTVRGRTRSKSYRQP